MLLSSTLLAQAFEKLKEDMQPKMGLLQSCPSCELSQQVHVPELVELLVPFRALRDGYWFTLTFQISHSGFLWPAPTWRYMWRGPVGNSSSANLMEYEATSQSKGG